MNGKHEETNDYTPTFNDTVRTVIYIVCGVCTVAIAPAMTLLGLPEWSAWLATAAGGIASLFGVVYNPVRMSTK
jgi:predicted membrane channel-forming protein YqfA (hemolysin III family)